MHIPPKPKPSAAVLQLAARAKAAGVSDEIVSIWSSGRLDSKVFADHIAECEAAAGERKP